MQKLMLIVFILCGCFSIYAQQTPTSTVEEELKKLLAPLNEEPKNDEEAQKNITEVLPKLKEFTKKYSDKQEAIPAYVILAQIYQYRQDMNGAIETLEAATKNFPNVLEIQFMLLDMYVSAGKEKEATDLGNKLTAENADLKEDVEKTLAALKIGVGKTAPDFSGKALDGKNISVQEYRGKVTLIDFWATWCPPCIKEVPNVVAVYNKYNSKGFDILGVSLDDKKSKLEEFIKKNKMEWRQYFDGKGWGNEFSTLYGITGIPQMILLDKKGVIRYKNLRGEALDKAVAELLQEN